MPSIVVKNFNNADEVRTPDKTKAEVVELGNVTAMKITLELEGDFHLSLIHISEPTRPY